MATRRCGFFGPRGGAEDYSLAIVVIEALEALGVHFDGAQLCRSRSKTTAPAFTRDSGRGGFGITPLQERIEQLGGTIAFGSGSCARGSCTILRVPDPLHEGGPA